MVYTELVSVYAPCCGIDSMCCVCELVTFTLHIQLVIATNYGGLLYVCLIHCFQFIAALGM